MRTATKHLSAVGLAAALALGVSAAPVAGASAGPSNRTADAGQIVYVCGPDLCAVDPASGASHQLTTDGRNYAWPTVSADGSRMAAIVAGLDLVVGTYGSNLPETWATYVRGVNDLALSPDGRQVTASWWYTQNGTICPGPLCGVPIDQAFAEVWSAPSTSVYQTGWAGVDYMGSTLLSTDEELGEYNSTTGLFEGGLQYICLITTPTVDSSACERRIAEPTDLPDGRQINLSDPVASPDGRLVAAVAGTVPLADGAIVDAPQGEHPRIFLYDAASGAKISQVAAEATNPSFSPDGSQIAYQGTDNMVYVVPTSGGSPRALVAGMHPTWSAVPSGAVPPPPGTGTGTQPTMLGRLVKHSGALKVKRGGVSVKLSCPATATGGCGGQVTLKTRKKSKPITKAKSYNLRAGSAVKINLKVTRAGVKLLPKGKTVKVHVVLKAKGQPAATFKATVRR